METLVETKTTSIKIRSAAGYSVCILCKGFRTVVVTDYQDFGVGWCCGSKIVWVGHDERCPLCGGVGFWQEK